MTTRSTIEQRSCDVLVLGAGLAGLRAAVAAKALDPALDVVVLTASSRPSGSSFANRNDALGVQTLATDDERQAFVQQVLDLAPPGEANPRLVRILAEEARQRCQELIDLGLAFLGQEQQFSRFPGCFTPEAPSALVFAGLPQAFDRFIGWARDLGVQVWGGLQVTGLAKTAEGVQGASAFDGEKTVRVKARAVVLALGGPAGLFSWSIAGPRVGGESYGLLRQAGARVINAGFLQFFWAQAATKQFIRIGALFQPGMAVLGPEARPFDPFAGLAPESARELARLARNRDAHCPAGYGLPVSVLDVILKQRLDANSLATVRTADGETLRLAPMAHAGNGGARIDEHGRTTATGLHACGECASGMHGANRIGGAMVAATQVFGKRAGEQAARFAASRTQPDWDNLEFADDPQPRSFPAAALGELQRRMQAHATLGGAAGLADLSRWLRQRRFETAGVRRLRVLSAETVVQNLLQAWKILGGDPLSPTSPAAALSRAARDGGG
jgi:L-aspartate oxidase